MLTRRYRLTAISGLVVICVTGVVIHQSATSPADAAVPRYTGNCWIDALGEVPDETKIFAQTAQSALMNETQAAQARVDARARSPISPAQAAEADFLARLKPSTPAERTLVAETSETLASVPDASSVWVTRRTDGAIDGTAIVVNIGAGRYAVAEKHFALSDGVDCKTNQLW